MTEKRFKCVSDYDWWGVIDTTGEIKGKYDNDCFSTDDVVDLMNELHEEKEMWKRECERLKGLYYFENGKDEHLTWKRVDVE